MSGREWLVRIVCAGAAVVMAGCASGAPARQPSPSSLSSSSGTTAAAPLSLSTVLALNPALHGNGYALRPGPEPGLSVWAPSAVGHIELVVNQARTVVAVRGVFPTSTGLQPWFDQAHGVIAAAQTGGVPTPAPGSQTTPYSTLSDTTPHKTSSPVAAPAGQAGLVGRGSSSTSGAASATVYTETLWLVPRAQAGGSSGTIPQYTTVAGLNAAMSRASAQSRFIPGAGVFYGQRGYGLLAMVDRGGRFVGVTAWFPVGAGWQPFYDQLPGHEDIAPQWLLKGFTQHVWLVAPSTIA